MKKVIYFLFLFIFSISYGENVVLTSIQPLYSIGKFITKDTNIKVISVFGSDISMDFGKSAFNEENIKKELLKEAKAVITISKIWEDDFLYEYTRRENINVIDIDASYSYSNKDYLSLLFLNKLNGDKNIFVWLSPSNSLKMAEIISNDLISLFPENKEIIEKNLEIFTNNIINNLDYYFLNETENIQNMSVITLTENFDYLFNNFNINANYVSFDKIQINNIKRIMEENNCKIIVSDRWLKKEIIKEIEKNGGKFLVLHTFNIPIDLDDKMDPDGYFNGMKENIEKLIKNLK